MRNLLIYEKCIEMIEYGQIALRQFPKYEKFVLAGQIRHQMYLVFRSIIVANKARDKARKIDDLDVHHEALRQYIELAKRLKYIDLQKYSVWMGKVDEIGRMIGGWKHKFK